MAAVYQVPVKNETALALNEFLLASDRSVDDVIKAGIRTLDVLEGEERLQRMKVEHERFYGVAA